MLARAVSALRQRGPIALAAPGRPRDTGARLLVLGCPARCASDRRASCARLARRRVVRLRACWSQAAREAQPVVIRARGGRVLILVRVRAAGRGRREPLVAGTAGRSDQRALTGIGSARRAAAASAPPAIVEQRPQLQPRLPLRLGLAPRPGGAAAAGRARARAAPARGRRDV